MCSLYIGTDELTPALNLDKGCLSSGIVVTKAHTVTGSSPACSVTSVVSDSLRPQPTGLLCPWEFWGSCLPCPGKKTGVGCHALLQRIFPTQGLNLSLLHCRQILYHWAAREVSLSVFVLIGLNKIMCASMALAHHRLVDCWRRLFSAAKSCAEYYRAV